MNVYKNHNIQHTITITRHVKKYENITIAKIKNKEKYVSMINVIECQAKSLKYI